MQQQSTLKEPFSPVTKETAESSSVVINPTAASVEDDDDAFQSQQAGPKNLTVITAFLLANLLQIIYMFVQACTKIVLTSQDSLSAVELTFFRSVFNFIVSSIYLYCAGDSLTQGINRSNWHILFMRCCSGTLCFLCFVIAIEYLPLSIFFVVMNAAPFMICLLAWLWLGELITVVEIFAMIGAFGGILVVGISKRVHEAEVLGEDVEDTSSGFELGLIFATVAMMGQAVSLVSTRRLKMLPVLVIQWYYALTSSVVTGLCVLFQEKKFVEAFQESQLHIWLLILAISIANNLGQNLGTWINQRANPATLGIMSYTGIGFSFMIDVFLFKLTFTLLEVVGTCICLFFSILTAIYKYLRSKNEPKK